MAFKDPKTYDLLNYLTLFLGLWLGVIPLVLELLGQGPWRLAVTLYLPAPFDLILSGLAVVLMLASFALLDRSQKKSSRARAPARNYRNAPEGRYGIGGRIWRRHR